MSPLDQVWTLLKEYYPDDISDEDYDEAEYAQNPQWPHKNWMGSPQWPQLCDFVLEGVNYNGCGRVIDGEEVTGLPMMSGQAICHDCLREIDPVTQAFKTGRAKIIREGAPDLQDGSWQDSIERGEPMSPFDIAFQLLKEEVIDMVEMPPGSGNFVTREQALATMRAQGAPMTDPNASSMERIRQARMLREQGI